MSKESSPVLTAEALDLMRRSVPLRIDEEGRWFHDGVAFRHTRLAAVFSAGLDLDPQTGEAIVRIGQRFCYVECVGTPFLVLRLDTTQSPPIAVLNNGDDRDLASASFVETEDRLAIEWSDGRWARLSRGVYTRLGHQIQESEHGFVVVLSGQRYPIRQR